MTDTTQILANTLSEVARVALAPPPPDPTVRPKTGHPEFIREEVVVGVELQNYTKRTPNEDGTHVVVITHEEHIEKIKQPPTPEEVAQAREDRRFRQKLLAGFGAVTVVVIGVVGVVERNRRPRYVGQTTGVGTAPVE